ncbi:MAG: hypothetical protein K0U98_08780 [Deltaproteobacteria bacterium]|nr:hypothetical protein [Deltaproteobacteria bacterium]
MSLSSRFCCPSPHLLLRALFVFVTVALCLVGFPMSADNGLPQVQTRSFHFLGDNPPAEVFIDLLAYASDPDGDPLTCIIESGPAEGSLGPAPTALGSNQGCTFLYLPPSPTLPPDPNAAQTDSFAYRVEDPWGGSSATATVEIVLEENLGGPKSISIAAIPIDPYTIEVSWLDTHAGQATYELLRRDPGGSGFPPVPNFPPPTSQSLIVFLDDGRIPGATYSYRVRSCLNGSCVDGEVVSVTTPEVPVTPDLAKDDERQLPQQTVTYLSYDDILNNDDPSYGPLEVTHVEESDFSTASPKVQWLPDRSGILIDHVAASPDSFSFSYTVEAGGFQDSAVITLTFLEGAVPIANSDGCPHPDPSPCITANEGQALRIPYARLLLNDTIGSLPESEGPPPSLDIRRGFFSKPQNGRIDLCCDPTAFWYVPDEDFVGDDVFTYQLANDGSDAIASAEVVVQVGGNGPAPDITQAVYDALRLAIPSEGDVTVPITFSELLQNDTGDDLQMVPPCSQPAPIGSLVCPDTDPVHGYMLYTTGGAPLTSFVQLEYDIQGADGLTSNTDFRIFRSAPDSSLVIVGTSDLLEVPEGENLPVAWNDLLSNDLIPYPDPDNPDNPANNPLDFVDFFGSGQPLHGSIRNVGPSFVGFTYQAPVNFLGADRMAYSVQDGATGKRGVAQVVVKVTPGAPSLKEDRFYTYPDRPFQLDVLDNDVDPQGEPQTSNLKVVGFTRIPTGNSYGFFSLGAGGELWYTPGGFLHFAALFTYTVEDTWGNQSTTTGEVILILRPQASASWLCEALHCRFTSQSAGFELQAAWQFPGGVAATANPVEIDFSQVGSQTVSLSVTDVLGTSDTTTFDTDVSGQGVHDPPAAALVARHLFGTTYELDWSEATDDVGIAAAVLDIDGTVITPENPVVQWTFPAQAASRPVTLTVTDYAGQSDQATVLVQVDPNQGGERE